MYSLTRVRHAPAGGNGDRHQQGGQHHEQHADPVDSHLVGQAQKPGPFLDELEIGVLGVELQQDRQRGEKGRGGGHQGEPLGVELRRRILAAQEQCQDCRGDERQKGDEGKQPVHQSAARHITQPSNRTTPSTIVKA
jgi:hypothetical protein